MSLRDDLRRAFEEEDWPEPDQFPDDWTIWIEFMLGEVYFGYLSVQDGAFTAEASDEAHGMLAALAVRAGRGPSPEFVLELLKEVHTGLRVERTGPTKFLLHVLSNEGKSA